MSSKNRTLQDLLIHHLKDLHYAGRHAVKALAKMAKAATHAPVRTALEARHDQLAVQSESVDALFAVVEKKPHGVTCEAMHGLIAESKALIDDFEGSPALDAGLVAAAQAMDHYLLARYAALRLWAVRLGLRDMVGPLDTLLAATRRAEQSWADLAEADDTPAPAPMTLKQAALVGLR